MKLDIKKWNEMRLKLETDIKATKHTIRKVEKPVMEYRKVGVHEDGRMIGMPKYDYVPTGATYRGGTSDEWSSLKGDKFEATALYALRAALRNKEHCKSWTKEDIIERFTGCSDLLINDEEKAA